MSIQTMTTLRNILVPTDFSQHSRGAVNYACDLASDAGSIMHLVHSIPGSVDDAAREKSLNQLGGLLDGSSQLALKTVKEVTRGRMAVRECVVGSVSSKLRSSTKPFARQKRST